MKLKALLLSASLLISMTSCGYDSNQQNTIETASSESSEAFLAPPEVPDHVPLINSMTDVEKRKTDYRKLSLLDSSTISDPNLYLSKWSLITYDITSIQENIKELVIYDEELDTNFLVHTVLPPNYDPTVTYPVFFITDAVWRLGEVPALFNAVKNGEASPVIFVSLGFDYDVNGASDDVRKNIFVVEQEKTLNFITDNLMPYLSERYLIDFENSTFFGHSAGGMFSHYALCMSDQYRNQPFGKYIIASPTFWGYYNIHDADPSAVPDPEEYLNEFGYFERNEKMDKQVFLYAGALEDIDYETSFNGHPSTTKGLDMLYERLNTHGVKVSEKMYTTHHYQYITSMLREYQKQEYSSLR